MQNFELICDESVRGDEIEENKNLPNYSNSQSNVWNSFSCLFVLVLIFVLFLVFLVKRGKFHSDQCDIYSSNGEENFDNLFSVRSSIGTIATDSATCSQIGTITIQNPHVICVSFPSFSFSLFFSPYLPHPKPTSSKYTGQNQYKRAKQLKSETNLRNE